MFRQYLACMLRRIQLMIEHTERGDTRPDPAGYASADALLADLRLMEDELIEGGRPELATALVRPVRREVESFRFSTVRLDVRENTTKLNAALADLWRTGGGAGDPPGAGLGGMARLAGGGAGPAAHAGRARRRRCGGVRPRRFGMFQLVRRLREEIDREAFGAFVLSMTQSVSDVLGAYLLAKIGGLFGDTAGIESCTLPIVPLFETIEDLQRAPVIMRELLGGAAGQAQRAGAGRGAGSDDRLLGLEQGRRLPDLELGAVQGPDQAHAGGEGDAGCRSRSSTGAAGR